MMFDDVCTFDSGLVDFALCRLRSDSRWSTCIAGWRNQMEVQHFSCGTPEIIGLPWLVILVSWSFPFLFVGKHWISTWLGILCLDVQYLMYFVSWVSAHLKINLRLTDHGIGVVPLCCVCSLYRVPLFFLCTVNCHSLILAGKEAHPISNSNLAVAWLHKMNQRHARTGVL